MKARVQCLRFGIEVVSVLWRADDLECDHLVCQLRWNLRQHLGDGGLEEAMKTVGVIGADVTEFLEPFCFIGRFGVPSVGDLVQMDRLDVATSLTGEAHDRLDPFCKLGDTLDGYFRDPNLLLSSTFHLVPRGCWEYEKGASEFRLS